MSHLLSIGIFGSIILIIGAGWPDIIKKHPIYSIKNWLFAIGGFIMLIYSILNYINGGVIFFIFIQLLIAFATTLMMLNVKEKIAIPSLIIGGIILTIWSLTLFEGLKTIIFIIGIFGIALGYIFKMGSINKNIALTIGSSLIAIYSYLEHNWVFFWLNMFFALLSGFYCVKHKKIRKI